MSGEVVAKHSRSEVLPEDFLQFLSKNYKTISDIERKVLQFQNDSWSDFYKKLGCRNWRNMRLCATKCDSVDSCFSDKDIKQVIRAKLKPKMKKLESNEQIDMDEDALRELTTGKKDAAIDFTYLTQNFPMTYFAPNLCTAGQDETTATSEQNAFSAAAVTSQQKQSAPSQTPVHSTLIRLIVEGSRCPLKQRDSSTSCGSSKDKKGYNHASNLHLQLDDGFQYHLSDYSSDDGTIKNPTRKCVNSDEEYPSSRQLLKLTLPPLHQSVLTLLGQKSGVKSSPKNHVIHEVGGAQDSTIIQKAKKLRRHGRKKKAKDEGKESEEKEIEKPEPATTDRGDTDELQETQLNMIENNSDLDEDDDPDAFIKAPTYMNDIRSLRDVLDFHLCKEQWSQKEMETLNDEIEKLSLELKKYQTEFKSKSITITEDTWLAFPRTCTHTTATFGVPSSSKVLKEITPMDYLKNYVMITEPRMHLYNLVYQRYRILENPTGTFITTKSLQKALTEVLGRLFDDEEMRQLQNSYLEIANNYELDPASFAGICAFTERIYGKYELEKCNECVICSKYKAADKERCHVKRKSALEDMDLSYLCNKVRFGEANESISKLIQALTHADRASLS